MKNWNIIWKDKDKLTRPIEERHAHLIAEAMKRNDLRHIELYDDSGNLEELVDKTSIKEVIKNKFDDMLGARWHCDCCGTWNPLHVWPANRCQCRGDRTEWLQRKVLEGRENV